MKRLLYLAVLCSVVVVILPAVFALVGCGGQEGDAIGVLQAPKGKVQIKSGPSGAWADATDKMAVKVGDVVKTGDDGSVTVVWKSGDTQELKPGSAFRFDGKTLAGEQTNGTIVYRATKKAEEVKVTTPHAVTGILGTTFAEIVATGSTEIVLSEGKLSIKNRTTNKEVILEAGSRLIVDDKGQFSATAPVNPFDAESLFRTGRSQDPKINPR